MKAPFPYFGGKSGAADIIWRAFGDVYSYVEPFAGSCAVLLARPKTHKRRYETVNDADGLLANFWRALKWAPDEVIEHADWPVNEADLHARHRWLIGQRESLTERLVADPVWFDAKAAGWWVWGIGAWLGGCWCSEPQKMQRPQVVRTNYPVGLARARGLSSRMRSVDVLCGDWSRSVSPGVLNKAPATGVLLDPPYADTASRESRIYGVDSLSIAHSVREWAIANGPDPRLRIALCGHDQEHEMPEDWSRVEWSASGMQNVRSKDTRNQEVIWLSPHCLGDGGQLDMFGGDQ